MSQVENRSEQSSCGLFVCRLEVLSFAQFQISPGSGDKRFGSIRQHKSQLQLSTSVMPAEESQFFPLQWVAITSYLYFLRKALEVGSVSWFPLTISIMS
jgi:hypothetical protein